MAICGFIGNALADEDFKVFAADSNEIFLYERVVQMWHDRHLALTSPGVSNEPDVQGSAQLVWWMHGAYVIGLSTGKMIYRSL